MPIFLFPLQQARPTNVMFIVICCLCLFSVIISICYVHTSVQPTSRKTVSNFGLNAVRINGKKNGDDSIEYTVAKVRY